MRLSLEREMERIRISIAGFSLMELLVVLIIVGILAALAIPNYTRTRERAIDKEAQTVLSLVQAAERMYRLKSSTYYGSAVLSDINDNLKLNLAPQRWNYSIPAADPAGFTAQAVRIGGTRTWQIDQDDPAASCTTGPDCPPP
ncbi:type II secretion system protein [bacterium]|nr:MAG: type II secretion system protein [bacterium]